MVTIKVTEGYCSFETAKLLKEKGFDEYCSTSYNSFLSNHKVEASNVSEWGRANQIYRPSQAMAMKWLREVHHLHICVGFGNDYEGEFLYMADIYDLTKKAINGIYKPIIESDDYIVGNPKTYEEACEAAIKYCLDNLI